MPCPRLAGLAGLGAASVALYGWLLAHLGGLRSVVPSRVDEAPGLPGWLAWPPDGDVVLGQDALQRHGEAAVGFTLAATAALVLYLATVRLARGLNGPGAFVVVLTVAATFQAVGVFAPHLLSQDVFSYAAYGRIFALHGGNPYLHVPDLYPDDPFYGHVYWRSVPSFYGPAWTLLSGALVRLAGDGVGLTVLLFRTAAAIAAIAATALVYLILREADARRALAGAVTFGWNPLLAVEGGLNGHNDVLMAALVVLAVALVVRRMGAAACGVLVLAGLVKVTALALLPLFGAYLLRLEPTWAGRARLVARCALVVVPVTGAAMAPLWAGSATFAVVALGSGSDRYFNSPSELVLRELRVLHGEARDDVDIPLQYRGAWVAPFTDIALLAHPDEAAEPLASIPSGQALLVVAPERAQWVEVFDPSTRRMGYARPWWVGQVGRPTWADDDSESLRLEAGPDGTASLHLANRQIRAVGWAAFAVALCAGAVFGTATPSGLLRAWLIVSLTLLYVTLTWFWPWYVVAALPAAALLPRSAGSRLVAYLSWGVLLLYPALGFQGTNFGILHTYRAIPAFGLPLAMWLGEAALIGVLGRASMRRRSPRAGTSASQLA